MLPILYSFRRCPYAMRARLALAYCAIAVAQREISLKNKPASLLAYSAKGTVPVLILPTGSVLEQSLDIMLWAMTTCSLSSPLQADLPAVLALIQTNDCTFKAALDGYKYADTLQNRAQYQAQAQIFLQQLDSRLQIQRYLFANEMTLADLAIFPFVRQCAAVDANWFACLPYVALQTWLHHWEQSALFQSVMQKYPLWNDPIT